MSPRHKRERKLFTRNRKLSKIAVAMAGVTVIVPGAVAAGLLASGASAGSQSQMMAMAGAQPRTGIASTHLDAGIPMTGAARREVSALGVNQVLAQQAAERAADRRAARSAARRAAQRAAAQAAPSPAAQSNSGSAPQPSGNPQQIAAGMLGSFGWSSSEFSCLVSLWNVESGWNVYASNPSSGAYGIPQALPGSKMASAGPSWQSDAATQIRWGLGYIQSSYGSPCAAWSHEQADGWY